jgi:hypothetical protein
MMSGKFDVWYMLINSQTVIGKELDVFFDTVALLVKLYREMNSAAVRHHYDDNNWQMNQ